MTVADTVGMVVPPFAVAGAVATPLLLLLWWQWLLFCCAECKMTWSCRTPFSSLFLNLLRTIRIAIILTFVPTILSGYHRVYEVESNEVHNFKALVECSRNCIYNLMILTALVWTVLNKRLVCMLLWRPIKCLHFAMLLACEAQHKPNFLHKTPSRSTAPCFLNTSATVTSSPFKWPGVPLCLLF